MHAWSPASHQLQGWQLPGAVVSAAAVGIATDAADVAVPAAMLLMFAALLCSAAAVGLGEPPPGWRDLRISQYRRVKGDAQLDQTYAMSAAAAAAASSSSSSMGAWDWIPWVSNATGSSNAVEAGLMADGSGMAPVCAHHISNEPMSELSYAVYMARRLPISLLVRLVRRRFRPQEFPASLEALYSSSPDEALPQFYTSEEVC
jgi:hypothetical protein